MVTLSARLAAIVDALPLREGMRVLEIGGTPGAAARAVSQRIGNGHILVIDRSAKGTALVEAHAAEEIAAGRLRVRCVAAEDFALVPGEEPSTWLSRFESALSTGVIRRPASEPGSASLRH